MVSAAWIAGKKSSVSLDHHMYYSIVAHEFGLVCAIEGGRAIVFARRELVDEDYGIRRRTGTYGET